MISIWRHIQVFFLHEYQWLIKCWKKTTNYQHIG